MGRRRKHNSPVGVTRGATNTLAGRCRPRPFLCSTKKRPFLRPARHHAKPPRASAVKADEPEIRGRRRVPSAGLTGLTQPKRFYIQPTNRKCRTVMHLVRLSEDRKRSSGTANARVAIAAPLVLPLPSRNPRVWLDDTPHASAFALRLWPTGRRATKLQLRARDQDSGPRLQMYVNFPCCREKSREVFKKPTPKIGKSPSMLDQTPPGYPPAGKYQGFLKRALWLDSCRAGRQARTYQTSLL